MSELKKILYAEDEKDIQLIAQMALESAGFEVLLCDNGAEAIEKVKSFQPDLILLDVMMPEMDGPTTLRNLKRRKESAYIPVVFMTAKVQKKEIEEYLSYGAKEVIKKPFDPLELPNLLKQIWATIHASS